MKDGISARDDDLVRTQLHQFVEDVEPSPDALPRLLATARRRRSPRRPLIAVIGAATVAAAAFLVTVLALPGQQGPAPVSVQPNSYLAAPRTGVIASFDVLSGRQNREIASVPGADTAILAIDRDRVYTVVSTSDGRHVVEISSQGQRELPGEVSDPAILAAGGGRVAYVDGSHVIVVQDQQQRRIAIPPDLRVDDLSLADDGRLAVLAGPRHSRHATVLVLAPDATSLEGKVEAELDAECGPLAISWTGADVAALEPVTCAADQMRVATFAGSNGRKLGAGMAFRTSPLAPGSVQLSADRLGRYLVSTAGQGQWLVDGSMVRAIPPACAPDGVCATNPGTFWR